MDTLFRESCSSSFKLDLFVFCIFINLVVFHFGFEWGAFVLIAKVQGHCLYFAFFCRSPTKLKRICVPLSVFSFALKLLDRLLSLMHMLRPP